MSQENAKLLAIQDDNVIGPVSPDGTAHSALQLIEIAGRTCYKSHDRITEGSAEKLFSALVKNGHEAMIEFSWLTFRLPPYKFSADSITTSDWLVQAFCAGVHFWATKSRDAYLVSGNFRSFRDLLRKVPAACPQQDAIAAYLKKFFPITVEDIAVSIQGEELENKFNAFKKSGIYSIDRKQLTDVEKIKHYFAVGRFIGSRAFTHQLVRHRSLSFAQESQRYCDETGYFDKAYFVVPPSLDSSGLSEFFMTALQENDQTYRRLHQLMKQSGAKGKALNEDARFLLPNAVKSEICVAGNLLNWFKAFKLRLDSHAQWEIRRNFEEFRDQLFAAMPEAKHLYEVFLTLP